MALQFDLLSNEQLLGKKCSFKEKLETFTAREIMDASIFVDRAECDTIRDEDPDPEILEIDAEGEVVFLVALNIDGHGKIWILKQRRES